MTTNSTLGFISDCTCPSCVRVAAQLDKQPQPEYVKPTPRTQKARGLRYLDSCERFSVPSYYLAQTENEVRAAFARVETSGKNVFVRPCPVRPRHGFVDSRIAQDADDAVRIFQEAVVADPDAECLVMPALEAKQSCVMTPTAISVGVGHDGVTGGKSGTVTFPLAYVDFESWLDKSEAGITDTPYVEGVQATHPYAVQLRDGPKAVSCGTSYVTEPTQVTDVWLADGDLLEWETRVKKAPKGTVIHSPGGSMLSHYAVHAVMRGLPVVFTASAPRIGDTLRPTVKRARVNYFAVARGLAFGLTQRLELDGITGDDYDDDDRQTDRRTLPSASLRAAMRATVFTAHQATAFQTSTEGCLALGIATGIMLRAASAACLGEVRHARSYVEWNAMPEELTGVCSKSRDQIYYNAFSNYKKAREKLSGTYDVFMLPGWSSAYGGTAWAGVTRATILLDLAARTFTKRQCRKTFLEVIAGLHTLINAVHNGGSWFNKFISLDDLDNAAAGDPQFTMAAAYALRPLVMDARRFDGTKTVLPKTLKQVVKIPEDNPLPASVTEQFAVGYTFSGALGVVGLCGDETDAIGCFSALGGDWAEMKKMHELICRVTTEVEQPLRARRKSNSCDPRDYLRNIKYFKYDQRYSLPQRVHYAVSSARKKYVAYIRGVEE